MRAFLCHVRSHQHKYLNTICAAILDVRPLVKYLETSIKLCFKEHYNIRYSARLKVKPDTGDKVSEVRTKAIM